MNQMFTNANVLKGTTGLNLVAGTIKAVLCRGYVFAASDVYVGTAIAGGDRISTTSAFTGNTVAGGVFDANDVVFSAVAAGAACDSIVIYWDVDGNINHALLIEFRDSDTGMPVTPNGLDIAVVWDNISGNGVFHL